MIETFGFGKHFYECNIYFLLLYTLICLIVYYLSIKLILSTEIIIQLLIFQAECSRYLLYFDLKEGCCIIIYYTVHAEHSFNSWVFNMYWLVLDLFNCAFLI